MEQGSVINQLARVIAPSLWAFSTALRDGAITSRLVRDAPRKSGAAVKARCSFAAAPRDFVLRMRLTKSVSN